MRSPLSGTFLIVDDDDSLRNLLEVIITSAGGETLSAANAQEATRLAREHASDIDGVLLDLNLDHTKGEDLYDDLVSIDPQLPIFPMSGCYGEEIRERLGPRPIAGVVTKPFLSADLINTLAQATRTSASRQRV